MATGSLPSDDCEGHSDVARSMGMQTPTTLSLPYEFIPTLQAMND